MNTANLQVPINKTIKDEALLVAQEYGFSSLQEAVRLFVVKLAKRELNFGIVEQFPPVRLSKKAAARYDRMAEEIESGKVQTKTFTKVDDLMKDLLS